MRGLIGERDLATFLDPEKCVHGPAKRVPEPIWYKPFMHVALRARPKRLLAEAMPFDRVEAIDRRLASLGRGLGAMRLSLGEGLARLEACGGVKALGFPTLGSYAREVLGMTARQAADARALARRLASLPATRSALVGARLSWSKVELIARVASPGDEADWIARADAMTVRQLRALVARSGPDEEMAEPRTTLMVTVDRLDAMAFESARLMVQALGARGVDGAVEAMLPEGLSELAARVPDLDLPSGIVGLSDEARAWREELARLRREGEEVCEAQGFGGEEAADPIAPSAVPEPVWAAHTSATDVDRTLRVLAARIAGRDLELGHLARRVFEADAWRRLGYASFEQYARERIGLSASSVAAKLSLARKVASLPEVEEALAAGRLGACAAALVARVAGPATAKAWVERAAVRTVKHLREEVEAVELLARVEGRELTRIEPPDERLVEAALDVERAVIAALTDGIQMSVKAEDDDGEDDERADVQDGERALPTRTLRLRVSEDTARFWRALERVHAGIWTGTSFVAFLARAVARSWAGAIDRNAAGGEYADVYVRDRWRCRSPVCEDRNVTPHHVVFRSQGGGEERGNLVGACATCHLDLVHGQALRVIGDASVGGVLTWEAAGFRVVGRSVM